MKEKINASFSSEDMKLFIKACELINDCDINQAGVFVNEVLMCHPIFVWNATTKHLDAVESVCINGSSIQLNLKKYAEEDETK